MFDFGAEIVVGGGPYSPARVAAAVAGERPLWIDVPGDPYAEAQAKSAHSGERAACAQFAIGGSANAPRPHSRKSDIIGALGGGADGDGGGEEARGAE